MLDALARRRRELAGGIEAAPDWTLTDLAREYLKQQESRGRRGRDFEARLFRTRLLPRLGATLLVRNVTAPMLARYERERAGEVGRWTVRHELGLDWGGRYAWRIGWASSTGSRRSHFLPKGEHRTRFLSEEEITRLLAACRQSRNHLLAPLVTVGTDDGRTVLRAGHAAVGAARPRGRLRTVAHHALGADQERSAANRAADAGCRCRARWRWSPTRASGKVRCSG